MTTTPIIFPDVELAVIGKLRTALAANGYPTYNAATQTGVFISNRRETQATAVWVRRDGGPVLDQVREEARVGINVFDTSEQKVTDLARTVSALLRAMADGAPVVRVRQTSGSSPIADSTPRRYQTFEITVRGAAL